MSFLITLANEKIKFDCNVNQTVLDAALENGVPMSYGCKNGLCGSCEGIILKGNISYPDGEPVGINCKDKNTETVLFCKAVPLTDLMIQANSLQIQKIMDIKKLPVRVKKIDHLTDDVMRLILQLPAIEKFDFRAGQWVNFFMKDGRKRAFSIANSPNDKNELELQIRHAAGGVFTDFVFNNLEEDALLQIEGPHGSFYFQQEDRPIILVAGGTGFAPIKGIFEEICQLELKYPIHLFWGSRTKKDLYQEDLVMHWVEKYGINYTPVLSEPEDIDQWQGKSGFVHQAVIDTYPHLQKFAVYMAGPPQMIQSCKETFIEAELELDKLYYDSFENSSDTIDALRRQGIG